MTAGGMTSLLAIKVVIYQQLRQLYTSHPDGFMTVTQPVLWL
jgi:hypothetical protein